MSAPDYQIRVVMVGKYGTDYIPVAVDADGAIMFSAQAPESVIADTAEATTWDDPLVSLISNLNRIRNQVIALSGQAWGTMEYTLANLPPLSGLELLRRDVNDSGLRVMGGKTYDEGAWIGLFGEDFLYLPGGMNFSVSNAAKTGYHVAMQINGVTDTPFLNLLSHQIQNLADPTGAQHAATQNYVNNRAPLIKYGATSVSDGGTVTHGLGGAPTTVIITPSVANEIAAVTAKSSTTFTIALKKRVDGSAGTTQTVYWMVC